MTLPLTPFEINAIVASLFRRGEQGDMFRALATGGILEYAPTPALRLRQRVRLHKVRKKIAKRGLAVLTIRGKGYLLALPRNRLTP